MAKIADAFFGLVVAEVAGDAGPAVKGAHAQHDARMLNAPVGVEQLGTHRADTRPQGLRNHLPEPARVRDLNVVVEQKEKLACCLPRRAVVERGVVEGAAVAEHPHARVGFHLVEEPQRVGLARPVIYDEYLQVTVLG